MPAATGTAQSLQQLYLDHHGWLHGWLRRRLGDREPAADIAHDTFLRLLVSGRFPERHDGRSYLVQIARNLVIDQWRRQRAEQAYLDSIAHLPEPESPSLETRAIIIETLLRLMPCSNACRGRCAKLSCSRSSYAEIAERLQVSLSSVQKYMTRAIQACYQVLYE